MFNKTNATKSKSKRRRKSKERPLLVDIALMACIHYALFLVYAFIWSSGKTHDRHNTISIQKHHDYDYHDHHRHHRHHQHIKKSFDASIDSLTNNDVGESAIPPTEQQQQQQQQLPQQQQQQQYVKYEPGYPKISRTHYFPTRATEKEMAKHDRYLVHGMLYTDMLNDDYIDKHWNIAKVNNSNSNSSNNNNNNNNNNANKTTGTKKVCMNILMKNRSQPYINALIMSLMMSHEDGEEESNAYSEIGEEEKKLIDQYGKGYQLLSFMELHLFDTERRLDYMEYDRQRQKVLSLPFLNVHRPYYINSKDKIQSKSNGRNYRDNTKEKKFNSLDKINDYLHIARQCVQSNLQYCLIMEEYTIVPIDFLYILEQTVIPAIEQEQVKAQQINTGMDMDMDNGVSKERGNNGIDNFMSMLSLFSVLDPETKSVMKIHDVDYSRDWYEYHRGKLNSERKSMDLEEYYPREVEYELFVDRSGVMDGGYNTAVLFTTSTVEEKLIPMLEDMKQQYRHEDQHLHNQSSFDGRTQYFDLEKEFATYTKSKIYQLVPSLINRIGFYVNDYGNDTLDDDDDEDNDDDDDDDDDDDERLGISNWLTDPRFIFEAGYYWEGRDMYCRKADGEWIEDEFYNDDHKSSCKS